MPRRRVLVPVIASILGHAFLLGVGMPRARRAVGTIEGSVASPIALAVGDVARKERAAIERRALVEAAREDRERGRLLLGRFLIEANRIDAEEAGQAFDAAEVASRYEERLSKLRDALREEASVTLAVPKIFGDLRYYGRPGGRMGDALLEGGGSCEQVAQLVVAAAYDAGRAKEVALRSYGKPMQGGATHLAPIGIRDGEEHDLMSGKLAITRGSRVPPDELIEVYARIHGLAPKLARKGGAGEGGSGKTNLEPGRTSLAEGFPPNDDAYPGSLPLYAARAVQSPTDVAEEPEDPNLFLERARHCAYFVRMAALDPPTIEVEPDPWMGISAASAEPVRAPNPPKLEREAMLLRAAEDLAQSPTADEADRLMSLACLASLGEVAAIDFTLAGERKLATAAVEASKRGRDEGKKALAEITWKGEQGERVGRRLNVDFGGRTWLLLFLEGGGDVVLELTLQNERDNWGRLAAMAALVLFPETRTRALAAIASWPPSEQVAVMHEIFHAHDHLRPWATNYDLKPPKDAPASVEPFVRSYRVFRGLAFRLWEGQRDVGECLEALRRESREAGVDATWEAAMLEYYARNSLGLLAMRSKGVEVVMKISEAARRNNHYSLELLRKQLAYIEAEGRLDARTVADAFRMR
jgi:hypothetical protein